MRFHASRVFSSCPARAQTQQISPTVVLLAHRIAIVDISSVLIIRWPSFSRPAARLSTVKPDDGTKSGQQNISGLQSCVDKFCL
jgi:hypothetical protein